METTITQEIIFDLNLCMNTPLVVERIDFNKTPVKPFTSEFIHSFHLVLILKHIDRDIEKTLEFIEGHSSEKWNAYFIILIECDINEKSTEWIQTIFKVFWSKNILNVVIMFKSDDSLNVKVNIYTYNPFLNDYAIKLSPFDATYDHIFPDKTKNLYQYPVKVSLFVEGWHVMLTATGEMMGIDGFLARVMKRRMNANFDFVEPKTYVKGLGYSYVLKNGTFAATFAQIVRKEAEMAFNSRFYNFEKYESRVETTYPIQRDDICFLVPHSGMASQATNIFYAFELPVWMVIITNLFFVSFVWYKLENIIDYNNKKPSTRIFLRIFGIQLNQSVYKLPYPTHIRIIVMFWMFYGILITNIFLCNLIGVLVIPRPLPNIDTMQQLAESNYKILTYGRFKNEIIRNFDMSRPEHKEIANRMISCSESELQNYIDSNNVDYVYATKSHLIKFITNNRSHVKHGLPIYHEMKECAVPNLVVYLLSFGSPYVNRFNQILIGIQESGMLDYWNSIIKQRYKLYGKYKIKSRDDYSETATLTVIHLQIAFYMWLGGLIISSIVFCIEMRVKRNKKIKL